MSGAAITYDVRDEVSQSLARLASGLTNREALNEKIARDEFSLVRDHLIGVAERKRNKFGAPSSGFWGDAATNTHFSFSNEAAVVSITHPGIGRAFHDVDIYPRPGKKALTIPLTAAAYNQRAAGMTGLFMVRSKDGKGLLARQDSAGNLEVMYLLVAHVHQKQDRSLLPPDVAFIETAVQAVDKYVDATLAGRSA